MRLGFISRLFFVPFVCVHLIQPNHSKHTQNLWQIFGSNNWGWVKFSAYLKTFFHNCTCVFHTTVNSIGFETQILLPMMWWMYSSGTAPEPTLTFEIFVYIGAGRSIILLEVHLKKKKCSWRSELLTEGMKLKEHLYVSLSTGVYCFSCFCNLMSQLHQIEKTFFFFFYLCLIGMLF